MAGSLMAHALSQYEQVHPKVDGGFSTRMSHGLILVPTLRPGASVTGTVGQCGTLGYAVSSK